MKNNPIPAKERIILPLDFPSFEAALPFITLLKDHVGLFKVGLTLFIKEGLPVIQRIEEIIGERRIFLDLKLYDTPSQLSGAAAVLRSETTGLKFLTVHASGGVRVIQAVVEAMQGGAEILGVTALTSQSREESGRSDPQQTLEERVLSLATTAKEAGAAGIVASGHEALLLKKHFSDSMIVVTPGIRPAWTSLEADDQRRTMTPEEAVRNGADYLVIGRPIYTAKDPVGTATRISAEIESVFLS